MHREVAWRVPQVPWRCTDDVIASRWTSPRVDGLRAVTPPDRHVVAVFLRATRGVIHVDGRRAAAGLLPSSAVLVTAPGEEVVASFAEPVDCLHLAIAERFIAPYPATGRPAIAGYYRDDAIDKLARALLAAHDAGCLTVGPAALGGPIVARLLHLGRATTSPTPPCTRVTIPGWRLARVAEFVEANLDRRVTLADIARAAGLSPMHFAAQFRAATGHRPHEYLQLCRIERAKRLLDDRARTLIDIALDTGFRTQAHFTTVFKRYVGRTPASWRERAEVPLGL